MSSKYTEQIQRLICLLLVLEEMPRRPARKQEVIEYIRQRQYLDIKPQDLDNYVTQTEPKWNTDIAFRRKDGVEWGLLFNNQRDAWELNRDGVELLQQVKKSCELGRYDVRECYLWTRHLKKALNPEYKPSTEDKTRPRKIRKADLLDGL